MNQAVARPDNLAPRDLTVLLPCRRCDMFPGLSQDFDRVSDCADEHLVAIEILSSPSANEGLDLSRSLQHVAEPSFGVRALHTEALPRRARGHGNSDSAIRG